MQRGDKVFEQNVEMSMLTRGTNFYRCVPVGKQEEVKSYVFHTHAFTVYQAC